MHSQLEYVQMRLCPSQDVTCGGTRTPNNSEQRKGSVYNLRSMHMHPVFIFAGNKL